jgi:hypothetical protein
MTTTAVPRLTLGLPTDNDERFLAESLDALLAQTFTDFELIISDNGSTDRTTYMDRAPCQSEVQEASARKSGSGSQGHRSRTPEHQAHVEAQPIGQSGQHESKVR